MGMCLPVPLSHKLTFTQIAHKPHPRFRHSMHSPLMVRSPSPTLQHSLTPLPPTRKTTLLIHIHHNIFTPLNPLLPVAPLIPMSHLLFPRIHSLHPIPHELPPPIPIYHSPLNISPVPSRLSQQPLPV